jgi:uncharacterized membrane protein
MTSFSSSVTVARPIDEVWDVWSDVRILPQLSPSTVEVRDAPERLTEVGQGFLQIVQAAGKCFESTWTVIDIVDEDHLTIEGSVGRGPRTQLPARVEDLGGDRTRLTLEVEYKLPFGPLGRLASRLGIERLARRESDEVLQNLAALLEARDVVTPLVPAST